ncbi:MAG TPA: tetratricopeptide repeat protein [Candidatus Acidoferrum sp.]|nr:tetratricopeptide repeat protein [Candidatus Acidoferrum sp.]
MLSPARGKIPIAPETARRSWPLSSTTYLTLVWATLLVLCFFFSPTARAEQERGQTPDISIVPKPINDTLDTMQIRNANQTVPAEQKTVEIQDSCLLPPLTLVRSPVVAATALAVPSKAKKEYLAACAALKKKKNEIAEKHLRKAVQIYPKYSAAWVTLGQMLAAQSQTDESRSACAQASTVEPNYLPAYLCLAELAAREKDWSVVSQLSGQVLALDPSSIALAYEYNAAANLRLNKLDDAEKSALRALEIDKNNIDPRAHFLLAQIYEAKGDRSKEVFQLHEYVKSAANADDIAAVKDYLSQLEKHDSATDPAPQKSTTVVNSASALPGQTPLNAEAKNLSPGEAAAAAMESDASAESDSVVPGCNLQDVLPQVEHKVLEFVDNVQQFTATELLVHDSFNGSGRVARTQQGKYNYVVSIEEAVAGMLSVSEYQGNRFSSGAIQTGVVNKGLPALLFIFHPYYAGDFSMRCEGLTLLKGNPVWQIRFRQRDDKPNRIRSYKIGSTGPAYEINLQGRAWFTADDYQIVRLEADLIKTIPEIQLTVDHTSAEYGPVHFQSRGIDIWLPQAADLVSERKGKRFHERIAFSDYLLFAVDNKQDIASPKPQQWLSGSELCGTLSVCDWNRLSCRQTPD